MKNKSIKSIIIKNEYILSPIDKKIIRILIKNINKSVYKDSYNFTHSSQKYSLDFILAHILYVIKYCISWRQLGIHIYNNVYKHFIKFNKINLFKDTYIEILNKYIKRTKNNTLKTLYTDTTFIINKKGIDRKERNKYMKNKNCNKVSIITDNKFVPIKIHVYKGNLNDSNILYNELIQMELNDVNFFIADKGYCSSNIRELLKNKNVEPIIPFNKRNTKDINKIIKLSDKQNNKYKERIYIEHIFSKLKTNYKIANRYEKYLNNYVGLLYIYFLKELIKH
jgi:hypothetical protein